MACAPAKTRISLGMHPPSLISLRCPHEERLGPYLPIERPADAQADLSVRWAHSHFVGFVMRRLSCLVDVIRFRVLYSVTRPSNGFVLLSDRIALHSDRIALHSDRIALHSNRIALHLPFVWRRCCLCTCIYLGKSSILVFMCIFVEEVKDICSSTVL